MKPAQRPPAALLREIVEILATRALALPGPHGRVRLVIDMTAEEFEALATAGAALDDLEPEPVEDDGQGEAAWQELGGAVA